MAAARPSNSGVSAAPSASCSAVGGAPLSNDVWMWKPNSGAGWKALERIPGPGLITQAVIPAQGKLYVLGGAKTGGRDVVNVNTAYSFDPGTGKWSTLPNLPLERRCWWGVPLKDEVLLFGGFTTTFEREIFAYRPTTHSLERVGEMPHGLCDAKFFRIGDSIFTVGGESAPQVRGAWTLEARLPAPKEISAKPR